MIRKEGSRIAYNTNSLKTESKLDQDQYTIDESLWWYSILGIYRLCYGKL